MASVPHRFAIVTNIPTPYRTAFFDAVAEVSRSRGAGFKVFYCATAEKNRNWPFEPARFRHPFEILPGLHVTLGGADHHLNPSVITRLAAWRPSAVVCAGAWHMAATVLAALAQRGAGFRTVFWSEGHAQAVRHASGVIPWLRRGALHLHHAFAVPNRRSAAWIRDHVPDARILLLPNVVDGAFFTRRSADERGKARAALGLAANETVILQVSQLTARKGVIALARAFSALSYGAVRAARLVLVGSGPLEAELRRIAAAGAGRVVVAGPADGDGVRRWLMAADWFALNSSLDPNPLSPIEASFARLPLLLTRCAGNFEELLLPGRTGFEIADPAHPSAALMQALSAQSGCAARMGEAAFENVKRNFDRDAVAGDLVDQLLDIGMMEGQSLLRCAE
jgi:glycosyltransferase involved in cell wall biosynthesis